MMDGEPISEIVQLRRAVGFGPRPAPDAIHLIQGILASVLSKYGTSPDIAGPAGHIGAAVVTWFEDPSGQPNPNEVGRLRAALDQQIDALEQAIRRHAPKKHR